MLIDNFTPTPCRIDLVFDDIIFDLSVFIFEDRHFISHDIFHSEPVIGLASFGITKLALERLNRLGCCPQGFAWNRSFADPGAADRSEERRVGTGYSGRAGRAV